jgi:hypothetical protein
MSTADLISRSFSVKKLPSAGTHVFVAESNFLLPFVIEEIQEMQ